LINPGFERTTSGPLAHSVAGGGFVTLKLIAFDERFVGAGFNTVTGRAATVAISAAVMDAVNLVLFTKVVVRLLPFHLTTEPLTKPLPVTVSVNAGPPTTAFIGLRFPREGIAVMLTALETKLAGAGVRTVIGYVPTLAISAARIEAVSLVEFTKVVDLLTPLKRTTVPVTNPVPLTVSVKAISPARTVGGEIVVIDGFTTRLTALEVPPPGAGFKTVIGTLPELTMSVARIAAVNWVLSTKVVVRALPLKRTTDPATKFVPLTVSVKFAAPAVTLAGERVVIVGTGTVDTVKLTALEVPPPGEGFTTVIGGVPTTAISVAGI